MPVFRYRRRASLISLATLLITACAGSEKVQSGETGGTMVIVQATEPQTLFPPRASGTQEMAVVASVFDRLAEIGPELGTVGDAGFIPRLASSWRWAPDSL